MERGSRPRSTNISASQREAPVSASHSQMPMPAARVASALRSVASRNAASASSRSVTSMATPVARYGLVSGSMRARATTWRTWPFVCTMRCTISAGTSACSTHCSPNSRTRSRSSGCTKRSTHSMKPGAGWSGDRPDIAYICAFHSAEPSSRSTRQTPMPDVEVTSSSRRASSSARCRRSICSVMSSATPLSAIGVPKPSRCVMRRVKM